MSPAARRSLFRGHFLEMELLDERFEVVSKAAGVAVLAQDAAGRVLGVEQHRPAVGTVSWELPAGIVDPGEGPKQAAERELVEEAQLRGRLRLLNAAYVSPGFTDEKVYLFEASDLSPAPEGTLDEGEELQVVWRDPFEAWAAVAEGRLQTSMVTLLGLRHAMAAAGGADSGANWGTEAAAKAVVERRKDPGRP